MDAKILEILLNIKEDMTTIKSDIKSLKDEDAATAAYLKSEVKPWIESHNRVNWLRKSAIKVVLTAGSVMAAVTVLAAFVGLK